jgi:hypothetical protein
MARIVDALRQVMPEPRFIPVSARTGEGIDEWVNCWLRDQETAVAPTHYAEAGGRIHA